MQVPCPEHGFAYPPMHSISHASPRYPLKHTQYALPMPAPFHVVTYKNSLIRISSGSANAQEEGTLVHHYIIQNTGTCSHWVPSPCFVIFHEHMPSWVLIHIQMARSTSYVDRFNIRTIRCADAFCTADKTSHALGTSHWQTSSSSDIQHMSICLYDMHAIHPYQTQKACVRNRKSYTACTAWCSSVISIHLFQAER
jgi:hypothetical protein